MNQTSFLVSVAKVIALILLGSIGASIAFQLAVVVFDSITNHTLDVSYVLRALSFRPLSLSLFAAFVVPGIAGLGLVHVFASYVVLFRSQPQFWTRFGLYSLVLIISSGLIGGSGIYALSLFGFQSPQQALLFTASLGYWGAAFSLSRSGWEGQQSE